MMNVKRLLAVLAVAPMGLFAVGCDGACDEHPRFGQVENERVAETEEPPPRGNRPEQAGATGSELAAHTEEPMEQCVEIVENMMRCTARHQFNEVMVSEEGLTDEKLTVLANLWREPGTVRQSCEQLLSTEANNPFRDPETLNRLVDLSGRKCADFARGLRETGAVQIIDTIETPTR
jgi:hypothetical protein